jgi:hypothetical protein
MKKREENLIWEAFQGREWDGGEEPLAIPRLVCEATTCIHNKPMTSPVDGGSTQDTRTTNRCWKDSITVNASGACVDFDTKTGTNDDPTLGPEDPELWQNSGQNPPGY